MCELEKIPEELKCLNKLELRLISLRILFLKMVALPSGKQSCVHGPAVNVPSKLDNVCTLLPRLPGQTDLVPLKLKRKLGYKKHYMYDFIRPDKVMIALQWLCIHNPLYFDIEVNNDWIKQSMINDHEELFKSITAGNTNNVTHDNITGQDYTNLINDPVLSGPFDILCSRAKANGFNIHNVPSDGNCLFSAITYQLPSIGMQYIDPQALRLMVVDYLEQNPIINGTHYCEFLPEGYELETSNSDR